MIIVIIIRAIAMKIEAIRTTQIIIIIIKIITNVHDAAEDIEEDNIYRVTFNTNVANNRCFNVPFAPEDVKETIC